MTHQSIHSDARPMARPPRRAAATLAVSLLLVGVAPTAWWSFGMSAPKLRIFLPLRPAIVSQSGDLPVR